MLSKLGKQSFLLTSKFIITVTHNILAQPEKKLFRKMKTSSKVSACSCCQGGKALPSSTAFATRIPNPDCDQSTGRAGGQSVSLGSWHATAGMGGGPFCMKAAESVPGISNRQSVNSL